MSPTLDPAMKPLFSVLKPPPSQALELSPPMPALNLPLVTNNLPCAHNTCSNSITPTDSTSAKLMPTSPPAKDSAMKLVSSLELPAQALEPSLSMPAASKLPVALNHVPCAKTMPDSATPSDSTATHLADIYQFPNVIDKDEDIEMLRIRLHEAQQENAKLQKLLEEANDLQIRQKKVILQEHAVLKKKLNRKSRLVRMHIEKEDKHKNQSNAGSKVRSGLATCHDIFLCDDIGSVAVPTLLSRPKTCILREVKIPGVKPSRLKKMLERLTPLGKILFLGMIDDIYRLHRAGLSLNGNFRLEHFNWLPNKKVKLSVELKGLVLRRKRKRMNMDYNQLAVILEEILSLTGLKTPADVRSLLGLMKSDDPVSDEFLIRYNICLMDELSKKQYTMMAYDRLYQLDKEDESKYGTDSTATWKYRSATAYSYISAAGMDWSKAMLDNIYVAKIYNRWIKKSNPGANRTGRDLVFVLRHCMVHLTEEAYNLGKVRYTDKDVVGMMELLVPGVFNQLQEGMFAMKQIGYPYLIRTMRA